MISKRVSLPELGMIGGTCAMMGAGLALLLADRLDHGQRRAVGWTLFAVGVLSTIPLAAEVMLRHDSDSDGSHAMLDRGDVERSHSR